MSKSTALALLCGIAISIIANLLRVPFWMMALAGIIAGMAIGMFSRALRNRMQVRNTGRAKPTIIIDSEEDHA